MLKYLFKHSMAALFWPQININTCLKQHLFTSPKFILPSIKGCLNTLKHLKQPKQPIKTIRQTIRHKIPFEL